MQSRGKNKQTRNYLDLFPVDTLAKIIFYLPEAARRSTIAKMPEFNQAMLKNDEHLKSISEKALALVEEDKNFKAAAALVEKHRRLLTNRFCKALGNWAVHDRAAQKTFEIAQKIHDSAKELDNSCAVGTMVADDLEINFGSDSSDEDCEVDPFNWENPLQEYAKVIWVRFGDITVNYLLNPHHTYNEDAGVDRSGEIQLNVYARTANQKVIYGRNFYLQGVYDGVKIKRQESAVGQVGEVTSSDDDLILATAIGLISDVGRASLAIPVAHCVPKNSLHCIVEHVACALRLCGRNFKTLKASNVDEEPYSMTVWRCI
jgi:hypothetical protein